MKIELLKAREIKDTRGDKTIEVILKTPKDYFKASAPNGKSKGIYETPSYKKTLHQDIKTINNEFLEEINLQKFDDLRLLEDIFKNKLGANSMIAVEYVFLKAMAKEQNKEVWQLINLKAKKLPMPVGNAIGGGAHSKTSSPDFQEFLFIPISSFKKAVEINKRARQNCREILKNTDTKFKNQTSDENAWQTYLTNNQIIDLVQTVRDNMKDEFKTTIHLGIDIAASEFFKDNYFYKSPKSKLSPKQQLELTKKLSKIFFYLEDPFEQNSFNDFKKLKTTAKGLIVGDDLTVTNLERIRTAKIKKSINAVIIKPNQNGSLINLKQIINYCRQNKITTIFSHRSGETSEDILADLAFGFQADFIKTGIQGKGRDEKLNRLIQIEQSL